MPSSGRGEKSRKLWGQPKTVADINRVFVDFCQGKISRLPWCESAVRAETGRIAEHLVALNQHGLLTVNSQPQVNAAPSTEPDVGWGGPGGMVYQKAYLELFLSEQKLGAFLERVGDFPSLSYQAVDVSSQTYTNLSADAVIGAVSLNAKATVNGSASIKLRSIGSDPDKLRLNDVFKLTNNFSDSAALLSLFEAQASLRGTASFTAVVEASLAELERNPPPPPSKKSYYIY